MTNAATKYETAIEATVTSLDAFFFTPQTKAAMRHTVRTLGQLCFRLGELNIVERIEANSDRRILRREENDL